MTQQLIVIGALPNDGTGDPLRTAFSKINSNFTELFTTDLTTVEAYTTGNTPNQVIFECSAATFTQAKFQVNTTDVSTYFTQNITLSAARTLDGTDVRFSGYGTIFDGDPLTQYSMDISGGNVRLMSSPLVSSILTHFIAYQITYTGSDSPGLSLALDGYPADTIMTTENGLFITTEI